MDVLRDTAILDLDRNNVEVLQEQLRETRDRFTVGEVTRTDVAQAEASLASAQATALSAESTLQAAVASYRQVIGDEPTRLAPVKPIVRPLPKTLPEAISISQIEHPAIVASLHGVDAAALQMKIAEGALYPTVGMSGSVTKRFDVERHSRFSCASPAARWDKINIPIYQGGAEYAATRQAKESLAQPEIADRSRSAIRSARRWSPPGAQNETSVGVVRAARAAVSADEVALAGVREEAKVGQRTTLDVLNAQQALLNARVQLVTAQHDQVVNSYALLVGGRPSRRADPRPRGRRIRSARAFRPGQEQVDRAENAGRTSEAHAADAQCGMFRSRLARARPASDYASACRRARVRPFGAQSWLIRPVAVVQGA